MQWLIDIVLEWIIAQGYLTTAFADRGDPAAADFDENDLTLNDAWHDLDLSGIVPEGATAVCLYCSIFAGGIFNYLYLRKKGNANFVNISGLVTQVNGIPNDNDVIVPLDANRVIQYFGETGFPGNLTLTVKGWWF